MVAAATDIILNSMQRLAGLSDQEQGACVIAERCLGVTAEPWDIAGREGVVDAMLHLADGRRAAFEVTVLAADGALHTARLLNRDDHKWPLPGVWWWTISVGSAADFRRLKSIYTRIILLCEAAGVSNPELRGWDPSADEAVQWLVRESSSEMTGHPSVLAAEMTGGPFAMVVPLGRGGAVDESLSSLAEALHDAFQAQAHVQRHFDKLARADADERHLFIPLHDTALPENVAIALQFDSKALPPDPPPVPDFITHLWLAPRFARRVLLWIRGTGWQEFYPYDN